MLVISLPFYLLCFCWFKWELNTTKLGHINFWNQLQQWMCFTLILYCVCLQLSRRQYTPALIHSIWYTIYIYCIPICILKANIFELISSHGAYISAFLGKRRDSPSSQKAIEFHTVLSGVIPSWALEIICQIINSSTYNFMGNNTHSAAFPDPRACPPPHSHCPHCLPTWLVAPLLLPLLMYPPLDCEAGYV